MASGILFTCPLSELRSYSVFIGCRSSCLCQYMCWNVERGQSVSQSISLSVCQSVFDFLFSVSVRVVIFPVLPAALERLVFLLPPVSFVSRASVWRGDWQVCIYWRSVKIPAASASLSSSSLLLSWTWQNAVKLHDSVLFPFLSFFNLFFVSSCLCLLVNTTLHTKHLPSPLLFFTEESH